MISKHKLSDNEGRLVLAHTHHTHGEEHFRNERQTADGTVNIIIFSRQSPVNVPHIWADKIRATPLKLTVHCSIWKLVNKQPYEKILTNKSKPLFDNKNTNACFSWYCCKKVVSQNDKCALQIR